MNQPSEVVKLARNAGFLEKIHRFFQKVVAVVIWFLIFLFNILVDHFFELSENEWKQAIAKYKSLSVDGDVNYLDRTATASIHIGTDAYFNNDTILGQFERLFQMLEFKQEYTDNQIEIVVDNARTHTTKSYSLLDFGKNVGTRCPVEQMEYVDENGATKVIDCYFKGGENRGKSKGLVELCKDLGVHLPAKIKLDEIRDILSQHRAFQNVSEILLLCSKTLNLMSYALLFRPQSLKC